MLTLNCFSSDVAVHRNPRVMSSTVLTETDLHTRPIACLNSLIHRVPILKHALERRFDSKVKKLIDTRSIKLDSGAMLYEVSVRHPVEKKMYFSGAAISSLSELVMPYARLHKGRRYLTDQNVAKDAAAYFLVYALCEDLSFSVEVLRKRAPSVVVANLGELLHVRMAQNAPSGHARPSSITEERVPSRPGQAQQQAHQQPRVASVGAQTDRERPEAAQAANDLAEASRPGQAQQQAHQEPRVASVGAQTEAVQAEKDIAEAAESLRNEKDKEISALTSRIESLQEEKNFLASEKESASARVNDLQEESDKTIAELSSEVDRLEKERDEAADHARSESEIASATIQDLTTEKDSLSMQLSELSTKINAAEEQTSSLSSEKEEMSTQIESADARIVELTGTVDSLTIQCQERDEAADRAVRHLARKSEEAKAELQKKAAMAEAELSFEVKRLAKERDEAADEARSASETIRDLTTEKDALATQLSELCTKVRAAEGQITYLSSEKKEMSKAKEQADATIAELSSEVKRLTLERDEADVRARSKSEELAAEHQATLRQLQMEKCKALESLEKVKSNLTTTNAKLAAASSEKDMISTELESFGPTDGTGPSAASASAPSPAAVPSPSEPSAGEPTLPTLPTAGAPSGLGPTDGTGPSITVLSNADVACVLENMKRSSSRSDLGHVMSGTIYDLLFRLLSSKQEILELIDKDSAKELHHLIPDRCVGKVTSIPSVNKLYCGSQNFNRDLLLGTLAKFYLLLSSQSQLVELQNAPSARPLFQLFSNMHVFGRCEEFVYSSDDMSCLKKDQHATYKDHPYQLEMRAVGYIGNVGPTHEAAVRCREHIRHLLSLPEYTSETASGHVLAEVRARAALKYDIVHSSLDRSLPVGLRSLDDSNTNVQRYVYVRNDMHYGTYQSKDDAILAATAMNEKHDSLDWQRSDQDAVFQEVLHAGELALLTDEDRSQIPNLDKLSGVELKRMRLKRELKQQNRESQQQLFSATEGYEEAHRNLPVSTSAVRSTFDAMRSIVSKDKPIERRESGLEVFPVSQDGSILDRLGSITNMIDECEKMALGGTLMKTTTLRASDAMSTSDIDSLSKGQVQISSDLDVSICDMSTKDGRHCGTLRMAGSEIVQCRADDSAKEMELICKGYEIIGQSYRDPTKYCAVMIKRIYGTDVPGVQPVNGEVIGKTFTLRLVNSQIIETDLRIVYNDGDWGTIKGLSCVKACCYIVDYSCWVLGQGPINPHSNASNCDLMAGYCSEGLRYWLKNGTTIGYQRIITVPIPIAFDNDATPAVPANGIAHRLMSALQKSRGSLADDPAADVGDASTKGAVVKARKVSKQEVIRQLAKDKGNVHIDTKKRNPAKCNECLSVISKGDEHATFIQNSQQKFLHVECIARNIHAEISPNNNSACTVSGAAIAKGSPRIVVQTNHVAGGKGGKNAFLYYKPENAGCMIHELLEALPEGSEISIETICSSERLESHRAKVISQLKKSAKKPKAKTPSGCKSSGETSSTLSKAGSSTSALDTTKTKSKKSSVGSSSDLFVANGKENVSSNSATGRAMTKSKKSSAGSSSGRIVNPDNGKRPLCPTNDEDTGKQTNTKRKKKRRRTPD